MITKRATGILLHPTSLPGPHGIGDLGVEAYRFIDFLNAAEVGLWQMLPLGPTGFGNSPYASISSFAGNPMLISLDLLAEEGLIERDEYEPLPAFPEGRVDYALLAPWKRESLARAARNFRRRASEDSRRGLAAFRESEAWWLDDFSLFVALDDHFRSHPSAEGDEESPLNSNWDRDIALREPDALEKWRERLTDSREEAVTLQYLFERQWRRLKNYAVEKGVEIVGDVPIFAAPYSADVWADRDKFLIDTDGRLEAQAGVPPDYFSEDGQLWGNPLYDWEAMAADGYSWWFSRIESILHRVDWVRIDHFRGFQAYWRIPPDAEDAKKGEWIEAPGDEFFALLKERLGELPIIAEDLGVITEEVHELRRRTGLPGMRVLQFAFEFDSDGRFNADHDFLPHNYERNTVAYTGTHDNDTLAGWYQNIDERKRDIVRRYLGRDDHDIVWHFIRALLASPAGFAIVPFQDLLKLGSEARMNTPSTVNTHNWSYRLRTGDLNPEIAAGLAELNSLYGRSPLRTIRAGRGGLL